MTRAKRPASAVWLRRWRLHRAAVQGAVVLGAPCTQALLAAYLVERGYRCSARTVRRWERIGPPAWVRRVLDGEGR